MGIDFSAAFIEAAEKMKRGEASGMCLEPGGPVLTEGNISEVSRFSESCLDILFKPLFERKAKVTNTHTYVTRVIFFNGTRS